MLIYFLNSSCIEYRCSRYFGIHFKSIYRVDQLKINKSLQKKPNLSDTTNKNETMSPLHLTSKQK